MPRSYFLVILAIGVACIVVLLRLGPNGSDGMGDRPTPGFATQQRQSEGTRLTEVRWPLQEQEANTPPPDNPAPALSDDGASGDCLLYGKVSSANSVPVSFGRGDVFVLSEDMVRTSANGSKTGDFAIAGLKPGTYELIAYVSGFRRWQGSLELVNEAPTRFDVRLHKSASFQIVVNGNGDITRSQLVSRNLSALAFRAFPASDLPPTALATIVENEISRFRDAGELGLEGTVLPDDCIGIVESDVDAPLFIGLLLRSSIVSVRRVEPGATEVRFNFDQPVAGLLGSLELRVVAAETGLPLNDARMSLSDSQSLGEFIDPAAGNLFKSDGLLPGIMELIITAKGYSSYEAVVTIERGQRLDLGQIGLTAPASISGRLRTRTNEPIEARVRAIAASRYREHYPMAKRRDSRSMTSGAFSISGLRREPYIVTVISDEWATVPVAVDLGSGDAHGLEITVEPAMTLVVATGDSFPEFADVEVTDERGNHVLFRRHVARGDVISCRVAIGRYQVSASLGDSLITSVGIIMDGSKRSVHCRL